MLLRIDRETSPKPEKSVSRKDAKGAKEDPDSITEWPVPDDLFQGR